MKPLMSRERPRARRYPFSALTGLANILVSARATFPEHFCETDAGNGGRHCDRADFDRFGQIDPDLFRRHPRQRTFEHGPF